MQSQLKDTITILDQCKYFITYLQNIEPEQINNFIKNNIDPIKDSLLLLISNLPSASELRILSNYIRGQIRAANHFKNMHFQNPHIVEHSFLIKMEMVLEALEPVCEKINYLATLSEVGEFTSDKDI